MCRSAIVQSVLVHRQRVCLSVSTSKCFVTEPPSRGPGAGRGGKTRGGPSRCAAAGHSVRLAGAAAGMAPRCARERASAAFALAFVAAANANTNAAASTAGARGTLLALAASQRAAPPGARGDACAAQWAFAGPRGGYVQQGDATKMASASATHAVAAVRTARGERAWLAATVNGGIWRTLDTLGDEATPPHWANVLDGQPVSCASISALTVSELDPEVAFAGCGPSSSSEMGGVDGWDIVNSGHWGGVMVTIDGGDSWSMLTFDTSGASLEGRYVSALEHVGSSTLLVGTRSTLVDKNDGGIFVCTAGGGGEDDAYARARTSTGIPVRCEQTLSKPIYSLVSAGDGQTYVAALAMAEAGAATALSTDGGASWAMWADGIAWPTGQLPFYPTLAVVRTPDTISVVLGALTVDLKTPSRTSSAMFWRDMGASSGAEGAWHPIDMPESLDGDAMVRACAPAGRSQACGSPFPWRSYTQADVRARPFRSLPPIA